MCIVHQKWDQNSLRFVIIMLFENADIWVISGEVNVTDSIMRCHWISHI